MRNDDPRAVERVEDARFLRGRGTFVDDLAPEGLRAADIADPETRLSFPET